MKPVVMAAVIVAIAVLAAAVMVSYREVCEQDHGAEFERLHATYEGGELNRQYIEDSLGLGNTERYISVAEPIYRCEWRWGGQ